MTKVQWMLPGKKITVLICPVAEGQPWLDPFTGYTQTWNEITHDIFGLDENTKDYHCSECSVNRPCLLATELPDRPKYCIGLKMRKEVNWKDGLDDESTTH